MKIPFFFIIALMLMGVGSLNPLTAKETQTVRVVEDGGTGAYSAIMYTDGSLLIHTIFRPKDLSAFGHKNKLHTPTLYLLGGESDIAYKNGMDDFERINHVPVFVANVDVGHGGTYAQPHGGEFTKVATAWYKWQLKSDKEARKLFTGNPCGLSKSEVWTVEKKNLE